MNMIIHGKDEPRDECNDRRRRDYYEIGIIYAD